MDVSTVFQDPLVPEPHCFTHPYGALRDNLKSNIYKVLKRMVNTEAPNNSNSVITDGTFLIQSTPRCIIYSIFVQVFLSVLKVPQHRADLCFDVYEYQRKGKKEEIKNLIVFFPLVQKQK